MQGAPTVTFLGGDAVEHVLLVVEEGRSRQVAVPAGAEFVVGRSDTADLELSHASVSRHHAELVNATEGLRIRDAGSHNGVVVNGAAIDGWRVLRARDVVEIGEVTVLVQPAQRRPTRRALAGDALLDRLADELDRASLDGEPVAVMAVASALSPTAAVESLAAVCEPGDVVGWLDDGLVLWIRRGVVADAAVPLASAARESLSSADDGVALGVAHAPTDGIESLALVSMAREAAAAGAGVSRARSLATRLAIGDRTVIVADAAMRRTYDLLRRLARSDISVVITGETGSGKENAARAVHEWSSRASGPFVAVNCAALAESVVESELFGHVAGAFTGAARDRKGHLESADGGTLFLDEIGELPLPVQAKLLRALDSGEIVRVGESAARRVDVRVVAATHRDLPREVEAGSFRQDLLYRLAGATVTLPPLRERGLEIALLAELFLADACERQSRTVLALAADAQVALQSHPWPGNVRELKNAMEYAVATCEGAAVRAWHLPAGLGPDRPAEDDGAASFRPLAEEIEALERRRIEEALAASGGVKKAAAALLGMPRRTFTMKLSKYGLG